MRQDRGRAKMVGLQTRNLVPDSTPHGFGWLTLVLRLVIGGVLLYAGFMKEIGPRAEFAAIVEAYHLIPAQFATPLAMAIPWIEMWAGIFLVFGYSLRYTPLAAAALFVVFFGAVSSALLRHLDLASCGCFGPETLSPKYTLVLDVALLAISLVLSFLARSARFLALDTWIEK